MEKSLKISVVIPAYNEAQYIGNCLDAIMLHIGHTTSELDVVDIIVVDSASSDRTSAVAKRYPGVTVLHE